MTVIRAELLTPDEFAAEAEPAFRRVFRTLDFFGTDVPPELFLNAVPSRLVLQVDGFTIDPYQFRAVREAAAAVGDDHMLCTLLTAFQQGTPTWRLPLVGYEEYYTVEDLLPRSVVGIPLTRALYSAHGTWGLLCPELFALLAGSRDFIERFKVELPFWEADLHEFLEQRREAHRERNADVSWVQPLLDHMYGEEAPQFLEE